MLNIKNIENRLQVVLTIALFFPVILDALSNESTTTLHPGEHILKWGILIVLLLFDYIIIEIIKGELEIAWIQSRVASLLLFEVGLFMIVFYLIASQPDNPSLAGLYMYTFSTTGILVVPFLISLLLFANLIYFIWKKT